MAAALTIRVSASPGEVRTALLDGDRLLEAWVERPGRPDGVGDLHRARVAALAPAMAGAFVTMVGGETGFLPESEASATRQPIAKAVHEGQVLLVRVTRGAQGGKGPRLTVKLGQTTTAAIPGNHPVLLARGATAAERLAALHGHAPVLVDDALLLARLRLGTRATLLRQPAFDDALEAEFDQLATGDVPLTGGGRLLVSPTPALVALDVDSGSATLPEVNEAAVAEAARQIRLRNLAGAILLDLAGLPLKRRASLEEPLRQALKPDHLVRLLGLGPLGLFEMQRQRIHPPLHEVLAGPLAPGLAALRRAARDAKAQPGRRWVLTAAPAVLAALQALPGALEETTATLGQPLELLAEPGLPWGAEAIHAR
jgi:Ribonuclease G/E